MWGSWLTCKILIRRNWMVLANTKVVMFSSFAIFFWATFLCHSKPISCLFSPSLSKWLLMNHSPWKDHVLPILIHTTLCVLPVYYLIIIMRDDIFWLRVAALLVHGVVQYHSYTFCLMQIVFGYGLTWTSWFIIVFVCDFSQSFTAINNHSRK